MITIYGRANSSNVRKVLWLCAERGIEHERLDYGRGFTPCDTPEYLALNPNGLIPTLKDGDTVVWESNSVLRYLVLKTRAAEVYPRDPGKRAQVEMWMDWQLTTGNPGVRSLFMGLVVKADPFTAPEAIAKYSKEAHAAARILDGQLEKTGAFVAGPEITLADYANGIPVHRWFALDFEKETFPALAAYYERLKGRKAFVDVVVAGGP